MSVRRTNLVLWSLTIAMFVGAAAVLAFAFLMPVEVKLRTEGARAKIATTQAAGDALPALASFESLWALDLRKPLDPIVAPASPQIPVDQSPQAVTLVGTIGDSLAMIRLPSGVVEVKAVGESTSGGAKVLAVRRSQVDVEMGGQRVTLTKPKEPGGG